MTRPQTKLTSSMLAAARAFAFFIGGFGVLNFLGNLLVPHFDANIWWIDLRPLKSWESSGFLLLSSGLLLAYAVAPRPARWRRACTIFLSAVLMVAAGLNTWTFYSLLSRGEIRSQFPAPMSLFVAGALLTVLAAMVVVRGDSLPSPAPVRSAARRAVKWLALLLPLGVLFPLGQMYCFGKTDYRRPADAIVVFGAGVDANGRCKPILRDRVTTACSLYREGLAPMLIFSGGPGPGDVSEPQAMRNLAVSHGVDANRILLDFAGTNTQATVLNTVKMLRGIGAKHVLAVSTFYHLPRVKLTYQRAGWQVYTVPAEEPVRIKAMPYFMAREIFALWAYYFRIPT